MARKRTRASGNSRPSISKRHSVDGFLDEISAPYERFDDDDLGAIADVAETVERERRFAKVHKSKSDSERLLASREVTGQAKIDWDKKIEAKRKEIKKIRKKVRRIIVRNRKKKQ